MVVTKGKRSIISLKANIVVGQFLLKLYNYGRVFFDSIMFLGYYGNSWCATTWPGGDVGGHYKRIFSRRIYMKIEFSFQRREMLLFLTTNMAAVTSRTNYQYQKYDKVFQRLGKTVDKNVQLVLQHCSKTSVKALLCVLRATFKPVLQEISFLQVAKSCCRN